MKTKVKIITTTEVEIDIDDQLVSERGIQLFSKYLWEVSKPEEIIEHVAYHINNNGEGQVHDFIGLLGIKGKNYNGEEAQTSFKIIDKWVEYEH